MISTFKLLTNRSFHFSCFKFTRLPPTILPVDFQNYKFPPILQELSPGLGTNPCGQLLPTPNLKVGLDHKDLSLSQEIIPTM